ASKPVANDVIVKLLAPKQSRVSLTRNLHRFFIDSGGRNRVVKFVRLFHALGKDLIEIGKGIAWHFTFRLEPQPPDLRLPGSDLQGVVRCELCPGLPWIQR